MIFLDITNTALFLPIELNFQKKWKRRPVVQGLENHPLKKNLQMKDFLYLSLFWYLQQVFCFYVSHFALLWEVKHASANNAVEYSSNISHSAVVECMLLWLCLWYTVFHIQSINYMYSDITNVFWRNKYQYKYVFNLLRLWNV